MTNTTKDSNLKDQVIIKLTEREHVLKKSAMYLGSSVLTTSKEFVIENQKFMEKEISYVPGLFKIFNELIDNSVDEYVRTNKEFSDKIEININETTFSVKDNGRGIPVTEVQTPDGALYQPELAWTHARAGSNFGDEDSATIGTNGVGSLIASVFSKEFIGVSNDGSNKCTVTCTDNNLNINTKISKPTGQQGVHVTIVPDVEKFGLSEITQEHVEMVTQRLYNLSVSYPGITFKLNGTKIKINDKNYLKMFGENPTIIEEDNFSIGVFHSDTDDFKQFSLMNGLTLSQGGNHVDYLSNTITRILRDKIIKKYKTIKPADIKRKLFIVTIMKDFQNPTYTSQTKEYLSNSNKEITDYFKELDITRLADKVYKNKSITDSIIDYFRIAEEYKKHKELESQDKKSTKKPKDDKLITPVGEWKNIFLCEGDCLEENTELLDENLVPKLIKDFRQGDKIISGDGSVQQVKSVTKSIKEIIKITTKSGVYKCSEKHRWYVYNKSERIFEFVTALELYNNKENYYMVKSHVNKYINGVFCLNNENNVLYCGIIDVNYTENDYFLIRRDFEFTRVHASKITKGDIILFIE